MSRTELLILIVSSSIIAFISAQVVYEEEFSVCPSEYRYAFQKGARCCKGFNKTEGDCSGIELKYYSDCCLSESVPCPLGSNCEDFNSPCLGWDLAHEPIVYVEVVGVYNISKEFDGRYFFNLTDLSESIFWNNRGVYQKENDDKCIWWQRRPNRRWILGSCDDLGENRGFAYLATDEACPYVDGTNWRDPPRFWKSTLTNQLLNGYTISWGVAGGVAPGVSSSAAAVSHTRSNGRFRSKCYFKYIKSIRQFRCVPKNNRY